MTTATATEVQNNFGKFLKLVQEGQEIVILKNGAEILIRQREKSLIKKRYYSYKIDKK